MPREAFTSRLWAKSRVFDRCYTDALSRAPTLQGDAFFLIRIDERGEVTADVAQASPALTEQGVTECILRELRTLDFSDSPPQGGYMIVHEPNFSFQPP